ncbi:transposase, IS4 family domain protein [Wolbachia pipientis wUni]|nr:transposase, IS4 family domain protein [Wolbachia pipientis wUni]
MVFGNIGVDDCSIETTCQLLNEDSIEITKQGLDFRFSEEAVEFMKKMYNEALCLFKKSLQIDLQNFTAIWKALNYWIAATLACPVAWKICTKDMAVAIEIVRIIPNQE